MALGSLFGIPSPYSNDDQRNLALAASIGLLSGQTGPQQAANAGQAVLPLMMQQQQQQKALAEQNKTLQYLEQTNPQLAAQVRAGLPIAQAWQQQLEAQKPKTPKYDFMNINGNLVRTDETSGAFVPLKSFEDQNAGMTSLQKDLIAAGIKPGTPEFNSAILQSHKRPGMTVESDGKGGFRLVQGDINTPQKLTEDQSKNIGWLTRGKEANEKLTKVEGALTSAQQNAASGVPVVGNYLTSDDFQKADQAGKDFLAVILRKDSGGAITKEEMASYGSIYLPRPGDSAATLAAKKASRETALRAIQIGLGGVANQQQQQDPNAVIDSSEYFK